MPRGKSIAAILREASLVALAAASFGFAANALSPHGLHLSRDYFPSKALKSNVPPKVSSSAPVQPTLTNEDPAVAEATQRIKEKGLQPIDRAGVERLLKDPRYQQGLVIIVDARRDPEYAESHIPGAYSMDLFTLANLAAILNACQNAEQVVVYCAGGECDVAEDTAVELSKDGVPPQKLFVYGGGFEEWSAKHLPLEQGVRNSGLVPPVGK